MNVIADGIYEYENYISDSEIAEFMEISKKNIIADGGMQLNIDSPEFAFLFEKLRSRIFPMFNNLEKMAGLYRVQRWETNTGMSLHRDDGYGDFPDQVGIKWGIVIYLNDEYEGGKIEYPDQGIAFKPKMGSMLIHRGDIPHQVQVVTSGDRYYITGFAYGDDSLEFTP
jgi:hypothetical protein